MNRKTKSSQTNRKYILLMKLSFPRWYITGSALVFAKVTRKDSTPFRCRQYVVILRRGNWPQPNPNKPVIILVPKLHGIRDIYSVHPISFLSTFASASKPLPSLGTLNLRNGKSMGPNRLGINGILLKKNDFSRKKDRMCNV